MKRKLFFATTFVCASLFAAAKSVDFPVIGFQTVPPQPIYLSADWDETQFGKNPPTVYNHALARIACVLSEVAYVDADPQTSTDSLSQCYAALGVQKSAIEYHYDVDYADPIWGNDQCAFSFAHKEITSTAGARTLVFIVIRGTPTGANEWISNIDIGQDVGMLHQGFLKTSLQIENALLGYLLKYQIQPAQAYFLITGHSRGAAVSNLLAANLANNSQFNTDALYVYTYAAPNVTTDEHAQDEKYNFIWNIVNAEDIVPTVPLARGNWKYRKYGHTRTLVNKWNVAPDRYEQYYYPKMNAYYQQLLKRDYAPFKLGPFIPIQITRLLSGFYSDVEKYYGKVLGLHSKAVSIFWKLFPVMPDEPITYADQVENTGEEKSITESVSSWLNATTGGLVDYAMDAFVDMHANESYLSWMLAFDEQEVFSELGNTQLLIKGTFECAVFNKSGELMAQIRDSRIAYRSITLPIASVQLKMDMLTIGFPANEDFTVVIYRGSLLPTPVSVQIEQYSASGLLLNTTEKQRIYPHKCIAYKLQAGSMLLDQSAVSIEKIHGEEKYALIKEGGIGSAWNGSVSPEVALDTNLKFSAGVHAGVQTLYGTMLISNNAYSIARSLAVSPGIGTQQNVIGPLMIDIEGYCRLVWTIIDKTYFDIVPSFRTTLSLKPRHRLQFFVGPVFDFYIHDFNDQAFSKDFNKRNLGTITVTDDVTAIPSIQFGLKF